MSRFHVANKRHRYRLTRAQGRIYRRIFRRIFGRIFESLKTARRVRANYTLLEMNIARTVRGPVELRVFFFFGFCESHIYIGSLYIFARNWSGKEIWSIREKTRFCVCVFFCFCTVSDEIVMCGIFLGFECWFSVR